MESSLRFDLLNSYELRDILGRTTRTQKENIVDFFIKYFETKIDEAYEHGKSEADDDDYGAEFTQDELKDEYDRGFNAGMKEAEENAKEPEENETARAKREFYEIHRLRTNETNNQ